MPLCSSSRDTSCFFFRLLAERLHYTASELKEVPVGRTGRSASRARAGKQAGLCARAEGRFLVLGAAPRCLQGRRDTTHPGGDLQEIRRERACFVATDRLKLTRPLVPSQRDHLAQNAKFGARYHGISMGQDELLHLQVLHLLLHVSRSVCLLPSLVTEPPARSPMPSHPEVLEQGEDYVVVAVVYERGVVVGVA